MPDAHNDPADHANAPGVVVIGRNEGERLEKCLASLAATAARIVYVDSGSTDGSVALARKKGAEVIELDMALPFTAARARNAGFARLRQSLPGLRHVQFVDGDCEMADGWLERARAFLDSRPDVAVVSGRLREKHPEHSVYNLLCDMEWEAPPGEARACGGIAMMRAEAFDAANGFRTGLIAGEEPELCVRLRAAGWRIWRLEAEMASHDAAMTHFAQWWRRATRAGHAFAQGTSLHGGAPERHYVAQVRSAWFWGLLLPLSIVVPALIWKPGLLLLLLIYPLQIARIARRGKRGQRENWIRAGFLVLGKFPEMLGLIKFHGHRILGTQARLIEHK